MKYFIARYVEGSREAMKSYRQTNDKETEATGAANRASVENTEQMYGWTD